MGSRMQSAPDDLLRYGIPCNAPGVLQIICRTGEVKMLPIDMDPWLAPPFLWRIVVTACHLLVTIAMVAESPESSFYEDAST